MESDGEALRNYVLAGVEPKQQAPEGQVRLDVISQVLNGDVSNSANNWKNFAVTLTVADFKKKVGTFVLGLIFSWKCSLELNPNFRSYNYMILMGACLLNWMMIPKL
jgi:hypothetical protein